MTPVSLYPLTFHTLFKDKIWGGQKIKTVLGKDFGNLPNCGETWEISGVPGNVSVVNQGPLEGKSLRDLLIEYGPRLAGGRVYAQFGDEFPLLVKFIDANDDLSIQVHPDDELAARRHNSFGKTEMWYIMQADPGSTLITGFNREMSRETYQQAFEAGQLNDILNRETAEAGDVFFLPAGRVHTIGKGLLLAEIQQTSDVTYRIYDFDRVDDQGNKRELHVEEALDAIDYRWYPDYKTTYPAVTGAPVEVAKCQYFVTNRLQFTGTQAMNFAERDAFTILVVVGGTGTLEWEGGSMVVAAGQAVLLPAGLEAIELHAEGELIVLESYLPA